MCAIIAAYHKVAVMLIPEETTKDYQRDILALKRAYGPDNEDLFYALEYCLQENIVVVPGCRKMWCRGLGNQRYEVIRTHMNEKPVKGPFPELKSGRKKY